MNYVKILSTLFLLNYPNIAFSGSDITCENLLDDKKESILSLTLAKREYQVIDGMYMKFRFCAFEINDINTKNIYNDLAAELLLISGQIEAEQGELSEYDTRNYLQNLKYIIKSAETKGVL